MGTIEVEISDPYEAMLEEMKDEDGFNEGLQKTLEDIIHKSYQENQA